MIEINTKNFYIIGIICFIVIGLANIANLILTFSILTFPGKIASIGGIIFNFALVGLFYYLLSMEPQISEVAASDDIDEIIEEISKDEKK